MELVEEAIHNPVPPLPEVDVELLVQYRLTTGLIT